MEQTWASASGTRLRALAPNRSGCSQWRRSQARGRRPSSRPQPAAATRKAMQKDLQRSASADRSVGRLGQGPRCRGARYPLAMGIDRKLIALDRSARFVSAASRSIRPDSGAKVARQDDAISIVNPRPPPGGAEHRGAQSHRQNRLRRGGDFSRPADQKRWRRWPQAWHHHNPASSTTGVATDSSSHPARRYAHQSWPSWP
jgi:hypothetical protein